LFCCRTAERAFVARVGSPTDQAMTPTPRCNIRAALLARMLFLVHLMVGGSAAMAIGDVPPTGTETVDGPVRYWRDPYGGHLFSTKQEACTDVGLHVLGGGVVASFVSLGPDRYTPQTSLLWAICTVRDPRNRSVHDYFIAGVCSDLRNASWNGKSGYCRVNQAKCPANASAVGSATQCQCHAGYKPNGPATGCVVPSMTSKPTKTLTPTDPAPAASALRKPTAQAPVRTQ
jgi:hypothetical protein